MTATVIISIAAVGLLMVGLSMSFFSIVVHGQIEQLPERFLGIMQSFKS